MNRFKLGVGPMSREINNLIDIYATNTPVMIVASRNQVDYNSGYVCTTDVLPSFFSNRSNILMCRDHCGPYFKDTDYGLSVDEAIAECKHTITADINAGFDLIHIDVSRIPEHQLSYADDLIDHALSLNPLIMFEFGSENNTGTDITTSAARIDEQLSYIELYKPNVVFFVTQTGSFTQHTQVGSFDVATNTHLVNKVHDAGFKFKEHNADYLNKSEVALRDIAGVDAMNIAPQLGALQTEISMELSQTREWNIFADMVYRKGLWKKWLPTGMDDKQLAVQVSGHYFFNTPEYTDVLNTVDTFIFKKLLQAELFRVFDYYTKG